MHTAGFRLCFAITAVVLLIRSLASAQNLSEYQVKAAYLYNFAKMTHWPEHVLAPDSPLIIGILGGDQGFVGVVRSTLSGKNISGHSFEVRHLHSPEEGKFCHMVFFRATERDVRKGIETLARSEVLLVGEDKEFLEDGGMIELVIENGRISYQVNSAAIESADLRYEDTSNKSGGQSAAIQTEGHRAILVRIRPEYPELAASMNLKGAVQLQLTVRADGTVRHITVLGGHPLLAQAAVQAVMQWRFEPEEKEKTELVKIEFGQ